ncbi:MAG: dimethyl sulfoxide reductase anchor subunit [Fibrobacteres bacterium]|nr:dimethyl sulfoxide reductase anchor subunit [Fibrobacterota bacterium]
MGDGEELIGAYLQEQQNLTAVERFSNLHDARHASGAPSLESHYRDLLPLEKPKPGQQYAFEVDLDRCTGCKACVTACHSLNGLDSGETWRSVGLIHNPIGKRLQQTVTTACQHCLEPGCAHGCPVKAYEKDPVTGIVKHLDDQCIGCEYCILKCPYDVPQYNHERGIVRKCDMCVGRLEVGEAPACVQACPTKAIRITLVDQAEVRSHYAEYAALPGAPDPRHTLPTTRYKTVRKFPESMEAADAYKLRKEKPHYPLTSMLTLSQLAVGLFILLEAGTLAGILPTHAGFQAAGHLTAALILFASIVLSVAHLGRPLYAFRAFLGLRRSWLSREILAFTLLGGWVSVVTAGVLATAFGPALTLHFPALGPSLGKAAAWTGSPASRIALCLLGLAALHCSAMIYRDTPRAFWATRHTSAKFLLTALAGGLASLLTLGMVATLWVPAFADGLAAWGRWVCIALPFAVFAKLAVEARIHRHGDDQEPTPLKKTALLLRGPLRVAHAWRFNAGLLGGFILPMFWLYRDRAAFGAGDLILALSILAAVLAGEWLERYLFFTACVPPRMPGA